MPVFEALRTYMDQVVAYDDSSQKFFLKEFKRGKPDLTVGLSFAAMKDKFINAGLIWNIPTPQEPERMAVVLENLPGVKLNKPPAHFDVFTWYLHRGRRVARGTMFYPLGPAESFPEENHINTFRGWNALKMVPEMPLSQFRHAPLPDEPEPRTKGLDFLVMHIAHCMGEGWEEAKEVLSIPEKPPESATARFIALWANMIFTPREKWPEFWILRGGQGVGKSSLVEAMTKWLLNDAHCMVFMDASRLSDEKNGHLRNLVLARLEEASPNDLDGKGGNKIKELVSGARAYFRSLYKEGDMDDNYTRFMFITNEICTATVVPGDRRTRLAAFNAVKEHLLLSDPSYLAAYMKALNETLNSEWDWRWFTELLWKAFSGERLKVYGNMVHNRRNMNLATLNMQLESMTKMKDTSILGWLYRTLLYHDGFFPSAPEDYFVYATPGIKTPDKWPKLGKIDCSFRGRWRKLEKEDGSPGSRNEARRKQSDGFWTKASLTEFYESYCRRIDKDDRLTEAQFDEAGKALFGGLVDDPQPGPGVMHESFGVHMGKTVKIWYLPPLRELEQIFIQALPTVQGHFTWDGFRAFKESAAGGGASPRTRSVQHSNA